MEKVLCHEHRCRLKIVTGADGDVEAFYCG